MKPNPNNSLAYHLNELEVACDSSSPAHILPEYLKSEKVILDIGCGIGQTLSVSGLSSECLQVGIDVDQTCLEYGKQHFSSILFVNSRSEAISFPDNTFDLVIARVALPYTNIPNSIREISRVLKPGGRLWVTLHPFSKIWNQLLLDLKTFSLKGIIFRLYVIFNGGLFLLTGKMVNFPGTNRIESFQTAKRMTITLKRSGFNIQKIRRDKHFLIEARK